MRAAVKLHSFAEVASHDGSDGQHQCQPGSLSDDRSCGFGQGLPVGLQEKSDVQRGSTEGGAGQQHMVLTHLYSSPPAQLLGAEVVVHPAAASGAIAVVRSMTVVTKIIKVPDSRRYFMIAPTVSGYCERYPDSSEFLFNSYHNILEGKSSIAGRTLCARIGTGPTTSRKPRNQKG